MESDSFNSYCASLPSSTHVIQCRGAHVWKIRSKVFTIGHWTDAKHSGITFKTDDITFEILRAESGLRPAPYFAIRGMKWIQQYSDTDLSDKTLKGYLTQSYRMAFANLTKNKQRELETQNNCTFIF